MAKFSKQHYQFIAEHIYKEVKEAGKEHGETDWPKLDALWFLTRSLSESF